MKTKKTKITKEELNKLIRNHNQLIKKDLESRRQEKIAPEGFFISLKDVNKVYPNHIQAVNNFSIDIKENEFVVFVGPSGCGKSTTLRMIAGLEDITCGDLFLYGEYANDLLPSERDAAMVFQSYALYPNMTVYDNLAFSLKIKHLPKKQIEEKVYKAAEILEIEDYLDRKPSALSGGQRQRVALGRAIVRDAKVFLMDEPLSNLDAKLRISMRSEIVKLHKRIGATTIYVTHDQTEAMTMADRIVVMNKGDIQQIGTPKEIFMNPNNLFVATFVGSPTMNIIEAKVIEEKIVFVNGYTLDLDKKALLSINKSYSKEKEDISARFEAISQSINEREEALHKPGLLKSKNRYFSKQIKLDDRLSYLKKLLEIENEKEDKNIQKIKNLEKMISRDNELLDKLEEKQRAFESNNQFDYLTGSKYDKVLKNDSELQILKHDIELEREKLAKITELTKDETINLLFGIRPENIVISKKKIPNSFETEVDYFELLGNVSNIHFFIGEQKIVASINSKEEIEVGSKVFVQFDTDRMHLFNSSNERRIEHGGKKL